MTTMAMPGSAARPPQRPSAPNRLPDRAPNRLALKITGRPYLSHSQLSLMRSCPRKFAFTYVENARPDFIAVSLIFGGAIHAALELHYRAMLEGLTVTQGEMLLAYNDAWRRQKEQAGGSVPVRFNKGDDDDTVHSLADRMLTAFVDSPLAKPKGTILGIEEQLTVTLDSAIPDLLAKVDLVTHTDGALHVIDFKTSRSRWTEQKALESGAQLQLYGVTVGGLSKDLKIPVKLHFAIITKAKIPVVQLLALPTDQSRVSAVKESVRQVWEAIKIGNFYPNPSPVNCATCQFRSRCPTFR
jgi:CRISPR/Cas system-associated exonuclease Cas4 (RecB family)